jgi:hypothetical protein
VRHFDHESFWLFSEPTKIDEKLIPKNWLGENKVDESTKWAIITGPNFGLTYEGDVYCNKGLIGGWTVSGDTGYNGGLYHDIVSGEQKLYRMGMKIEDGAGERFAWYVKEFNESYQSEPTGKTIFGVRYNGEVVSRSFRATDKGSVAAFHFGETVRESEELYENCGLEAWSKSSGAITSDGSRGKTAYISIKEGVSSTNSTKPAYELMCQGRGIHLENASNNYISITTDGIDFNNWGYVKHDWTNHELLLYGDDIRFIIYIPNTGYRNYSLRDIVSNL